LDNANGGNTIDSMFINTDTFLIFSNGHRYFLLLTAGREKMYSTQMDAAKKGIITKEIKAVAKYEQFPV